MIFSLLQGADIGSNLLPLLITLPVILFALSAHETSHGFAAYCCGDPTARNLGRLTLNPLRHLDPIGFLCMFIFGFGWAKPVPINARYFNNPRRGMAITAAAGPAANLILGIFSAILMGVFWGCYVSFAYLEMAEFLCTVMFWFSEIFFISAYANFSLMAFNLIPIPPFDGSRIINILLPDRIYFGLMRYERQIMYSLLILLFLCSRFFNFSPFSWIAETLTGLISNLFSNLTLHLIF